MIFLSDILELHQLSINKYGGAVGVRDMGLLESAIARPFQTFNGIELYTTPIEKAAALAESIITNHPFVDGNKRAGALAMFAFLKEYNIQLTCTNNVLYDFIISISTSQTAFESIVNWIKENSK